MSVDPKDATPGRAYEVKFDGERRNALLAYVGDDRPWCVAGGVNGFIWEPHVALSDLVPLVPARPVTRGDLPTLDELREKAEADNPLTLHLPPYRVLNAVVDHLNERGGIPAEVLGNSEKSEKSPCCEEAALNADEAKAAQTRWEVEFKRAEHALTELSHRNDELAKAQDKIASLTMELGEANDARREWANTCAALRKRAEKAERERGAINDSANYWNQCAADTAAERDELRRKLDAAENRPKLDREAVLAELNHRFGEYGSAVVGAADAIMSLAGQAATSDEDQRVEEQARALYAGTRTIDSLLHWDHALVAEAVRNAYRAEIRAGWTPPESEA